MYRNSVCNDVNGNYQWCKKTEIDALYVFFTIAGAEDEDEDGG